MIKRWCAYLLGFWNVFYFILRHEKRISDYLSVFASTKTNLNGNWACVIIFFHLQGISTSSRCKKLYKWSSLQMMLHFNIRILALLYKLHKTVRQCYWYTLLLRSIELYLIYNEDLTTNLPRCWFNCAGSTTLLVRFYPESCMLRSYYTCFEHVQNKRVRSVVLPKHKDATSTLLRLWRPNKASSTIRHDRGGGG